jgi:hypothetical protein
MVGVEADCSRPLFVMQTGEQRSPLHCDPVYFLKDHHCTLQTNLDVSHNNLQ